MRTKMVVGTGSYTPERIVTNHDIERTALDFDRARAGMTLDEWCLKRMGANERRRVTGRETTSDMAIAAAKAALKDAGIEPAAVDVIVLATVTSDYVMPPTAALVQSALGITARFIQIDSACTGFLDALMLADGLMDRMGYETALVIGADAMSHLLDPHRFREQTIFGDGAGAVILRAGATNGYGVIAYSSGSSGADGFMVEVRGGGTKHPFSAEMMARREQYIRLGRDIPVFGVEKMVQAAREVLSRAGVAVDEVDWIVPHQASWNMIRDSAAQLGIGLDHFVVNFDCFGNTSAGSIPLTLDYGNRLGLFRDGQKLLLPAVGAGMAWSAAYMVWYDYRAERDGRAEASRPRP